MTSVAVTLDDQRGDNFFNVFIDGDLDHPRIIDAEPGAKTYQVASGLAPGAHRFLITKRTEGKEGATAFQGIELSDGGKLLAPPRRKPHRIEFFGDSITSGMGNESPSDGPDDRLRDKNSFMSYASIAARDLNAEAHLVSYSGIGVMISWPPFVMPDYYDQLSGVGNNDTVWNFRSWTPEVVVINLMQNDSTLQARPGRIVPVPDDAQRVRAYRQFVERIRALYPRAYIVCALGSMDATKQGSKWPGYISTAVEQIRQQSGDRNIDTLVFPFTGFSAHPRVSQHRANAALLTKLVRQKMGW